MGDPKSATLQIITDELHKRSVIFNPIPTGLWNDVTNWGGAIMARTDFRLSKMTKRPVSAQNLLSNEYFDL